MIEIGAACLVVTALLAVVNHRYVGLPMAIGVMAIALAVSLLFVALDALGVSHALRDLEVSLLRSIDFSRTLMQGMLSLLLFAGALQVDLSGLREHRWQIVALTLLGTLASTVVVGFGLWGMLSALGLPLPLLQCLLFGALISPTDPIAVLAIVRSAGAPRSLELVITAESLFNDGVGVVIFATLAEIAQGQAVPGWGAGALLLRQAGGGLLFGALLGAATIALLRSIDQVQIEVMITLAAVTGGYALADRLQVSGPLAMVVTGVLVGNQGRALAMSAPTRHQLDLFWELLDCMLNAVLFVLIGMQVVVIRFEGGIVATALGAVAVTLLARWLTVGLPVGLWPRRFRLPAGAGAVLTWGGLRGGISVALALSLPAGSDRETLLAMTYCVVVFSILVQGLTIGRVVRRQVTGRV